MASLKRTGAIILYLNKHPTIVLPYRTPKLATEVL
jgi:hypothetical protein